MIVVQELVYIALDTIYGFIFFADSSIMVLNKKIVHATNCLSNDHDHNVQFISIKHFLDDDLCIFQTIMENTKSNSYIGR